MDKGLRLTEKWLQRALWLVAFVFAGFLIGLGSLVVGNLWDVESPLTVEQFMDPARLAKARADQRLARERLEAARERLEGVLQEMLAPIRARREEFAKDRGQVLQILKEGTARAREIAAVTTDEVKKALGLSYF